MAAVRGREHLDLCPLSFLPPLYLSPLLAEMAHGRHAISLGCPLLTTPETYNFVEQAEFESVVAHGPHSASAAVGSLLAGCDGLHALSCEGGLVPTQFPVDLEFLRIWLGNKRADQLCPVLQCVLDLPVLYELQLLLETRVLFPAQVLDFGALRRLTLCIYVAHDTVLENFAALRPAAAAGVSVRVEISLQMGSSRLRQRLWAALAQLPPLQQLRLKLVFGGWGEAPSPEELQPSASLRCAELVLSYVLESPFADLVLRLVTCTQLCSQSYFCGKPSTLTWSQLSSRAGVYALQISTIDELLVTGCDGSLPLFAEPWACVIQQPQGLVTGLPIEAFQPGPAGCLVWRNAAASDQAVLAALSTLSGGLMSEMED